MRTRPRHALVAASLAVTVGLGSAAPAAYADTRPPAPTHVTTDVTTQAVAFDWVSAAIAVASALLRGNGDSSGAIRQILAAVEAAKTEIISHTDLIASAEVQACVEASTIEFANIEFFPPPVLILWAQNATSCATLATAFIQAIVTPQAVDNIGFLVGSIFAIVLAARAKAGLVNGVDLILKDEIRSYQAVLGKLGPAPGACVPFRIEGQIEYYTCHAYNGDTGRDYPALAAWNIAARNTSWPIANDALPRLQAVLG